MARIFIGIPLGKNISDEIESTLSPLGAFQKEFFWNPKANWHITLAFIGEVDQSKLSEVQKAFSAYAVTKKYFNVYFNGVESFPDRVPKKLVLTMVKNRNLMDLQYGLREVLRDYIAPEEYDRKFLPHVTIASLKRHFNHEKLLERAKGLEFKKRFEVDTISCIETIQVEKPPVAYRVLSEAKMIVDDKFDPEDVE